MKQPSSPQTRHTLLPEPAARPVVQTESGPVRGLWRPSSAAFLGIPFAEAPVGELRFAAPVPAKPWTGVRDALRYGPTPQRRPFAETTTIPEPSIPGSQTLNVNVFTPAPADTSAKLPVLVWIHGGGYFAGSPASPWYDGRAFNRDGIVTVTISYRLGFDGFGWIDDAPANRGVLDQIAALEWVQRNITQFGGDPGRVTIAGQSAGGGSVLSLMSAPAADDLFAAAISQSGAVSSMRPEAARATAVELGQRLGLRGNTAAEWQTVGEDTLLEAERLLTFERMSHSQGLPLEDLVHTLAAAHSHPLDLAFMPVIDGQSVHDVEECMLAGAHARIPLLLGTTLNEFVTPSDESPRRETVSETLRRIGASEAGLNDFWAEADRLGPAYVRSQLMAVNTFRVPAVSLAATRNSAGSGSRTWLYDFRYQAPAGNAAAHCMELPFVWDLGTVPGVIEALGGPPPGPLADAMHTDWVAFLTYGTAPWPSMETEAAGAKIYDHRSEYSPAAYRLEQDIASRSRAHTS
jgi:para-nitrobenzyl esterase